MEHKKDLAGLTVRALRARRRRLASGLSDVEALLRGTVVTLRHLRVRVGAGSRRQGLFGSIDTLLLVLIVLIKIGCLVGLGAGYAGLFGVRCGRGRLGVRRA